MALDVSIEIGVCTTLLIFLQYSTTMDHLTPATPTETDKEVDERQCKLSPKILLTTSWEVEGH